MQLPPVHKLFFCSCIQTITHHAGIRWQWQKQQWWYCFFYYFLFFYFIETEMWHHSNWGKWKTIFTNMMKNFFSNFLTCLTDPSKFVHLSTKLICSSRQGGSFWHCTQTVQQQVTRHFLAKISLTITWMQRAAIHLHFRDNGALLSSSTREGEGGGCCKIRISEEWKGILWEKDSPGKHPKAVVLSNSL